MHSFLFNAGINSADVRPRREYSYWIGEKLPDDRFAGAELVRRLSTKAKEQVSSIRIPVVAMAGNPSSGAYQARAAGLSETVDSDSRLDFKQFAPADWSRETAKGQFSTLWRRYGKDLLFWCANDNMALGLIDAALEKGVKPGSDFIIGGIDWLPESLVRVESGEMHVSIGGHFVEGIWALILMYDFLNGFDFEQAHGNRLKTQMLALTQEDLKKYGDITALLSKQNIEKMDFSKYSKVHNPDLKHYPFEISHLLEQLSKS